MEKRIHAEMLLVQVGEMSSILDSVEDEIVDAALLLYTYAYAYDRDAINDDLIDSLIGAAKKDFKSTEKIMNSYKRSDTGYLFDRWSLYYKSISPVVDRKYIVVNPVNKIQVTKPITKVVKKNILYADAATERAKVLVQKYLEGNMHAHKLKITPANCHQRVFSAGGQRFFFVVTCEGIVLNENQTATFTEENPLEVEILAEVGDCDQLRRIDLFFWRRSGIFLCRL